MPDKFVDPRTLRIGDRVHQSGSFETWRICGVMPNCVHFWIEQTHKSDCLMYKDEATVEDTRLILLDAVPRDPWSWRSCAWGFLLGLAVAWVFYRIALPLYLGHPLIPTKPPPPTMYQIEQRIHETTKLLSAKRQREYQERLYATPPDPKLDPDAPPHHP